MIVYQITNSLNGKTYIGKTKKPFDVRWKQHCYPSAAEENRHLSRAIKKFGLSNFKTETLFICSSEEEMSFLECLWIIATKSYDPNFGYNLTFGGDGLHNPSNDTRKKMSVSQTGKKQTTETKEKRRHSLRTAWTKRKERGDHLSLISRAKKINEGRKGKTWEEIFGVEVAERLRSKRKDTALLFLSQKKIVNSISIGKRG